MPRLVATEAYFLTTEASEAFFYSNRSLSTINFLVTFNEFLIFNENHVYPCDFADFLIFSDFWKGGGLWKFLKIRKSTESTERVLIYSNQRSQPWPFRAWGTHTRLKKNSRLLDPCPGTQSYSLKKKIHAYWLRGPKSCHIRLKNNSCLLGFRSQR